jgi:hypothetical protein
MPIFLGQSVELGGPSLAGWSVITLKRRSKMLETIAVLLVILWLLGLVSSYTLGGFIHILPGSRYFCERFFRASCSKNQQKLRDR